MALEVFGSGGCLVVLAPAYREITHLVVTDQPDTRGLIVLIVGYHDIVCSHL
jgi:hypothetical protein